jgi:hypothetical protein
MGAGGGTGSTKTPDQWHKIQRVAASSRQVFYEGFKRVSTPNLDQADAPLGLGGGLEEPAVDGGIIP